MGRAHKYASACLPLSRPVVRLYPVDRIALSATTRQFELSSEGEDHF